MTERTLSLDGGERVDDQMFYTLMVGPTNDALLGLIVGDDGTMQIISWPDGINAVPLGAVTLPDPDEARLDAAMARALDAIPEQVELVDIAYDDQLTDEQIQSAFKGTPPFEIADLDEWESDARHAGLWATLESYVDTEDLDLLRADQSRFDELQQAVEERDLSDPFGALARRTPHKWIRYTLDVEPVSVWASAEDEITEDMQTIAEELGIEWNQGNRVLLRELVTNAGGGGRLHILWYGAVDELIDAAQQEDADGKPQTITWENPHLLVLSTAYGSGHMVSYEGTITLPFDRNRLKLDARNVGNGYSWSEDVTGGLYSDVSTTVTIKENANA